MKLACLVSVLSLSILISCKDEQVAAPTLGSLHGRTIDERYQRPLEFVQITTNPPSASVISDENGVFVIENVKPNDYTINGQYRDSAYGAVTASVIAGVTTQADMVMHFPAARPSSIPSEGLIAYYPLNGNGVDFGNHGFNAERSGGTFTRDRNGVDSMAYRTVGTVDEGMFVDHNIAFNVIPLTLAAWIRNDDPSSDGCLILGKNVHPNGDGYFLLIDSQWLICEYVSDSFTKGYRAVITYLRPHEWHHVAMTISDTAALVYLDGQPDEVPFVGAPVSVVRNMGRFGIGSNDVSTGGFRGFTGAIDDVFIYNRVLSDEEILVLKNVKF